jgi:molybdopterin-binding protein
MRRAAAAVSFLVGVMAMKLAAGRTAYAIIKATSVMVAVD